MCVHSEFAFEQQDLTTALELLKMTGLDRKEVISPEIKSPCRLFQLWGIFRRSISVFALNLCWEGIRRDRPINALGSNKNRSNVWKKSPCELNASQSPVLVVSSVYKSDLFLSQICIRKSWAHSSAAAMQRLSLRVFSCDLWRAFCWIHCGHSYIRQNVLVSWSLFAIWACSGSSLF